MKYIIVCILFIPTLLNAQKAEKYLFAGTNICSYKGDMGTFEQWNAGIQSGIQFNKKKKINGAVHLTFGAISDQKAVRENTQLSQVTQPNYYFKSSFFSINYEIHYNIIKNEKWTIYLGQGIGFIKYTPKDEFGEKLEDQPFTRAEQEGFSSSSLMLPSSLGVIYYLPNGLGLGLQSVFKNPLTDYLDNISELGSSGNDNILSVKFSLMFPFNLNNEN